MKKLVYFYCCCPVESSQVANNIIRYLLQIMHFFHVRIRNRKLVEFNDLLKIHEHKELRNFLHKVVLNSYTTSIITPVKCTKQLMAIRQKRYRGL